MCVSNDISCFIEAKEMAEPSSCYYFFDDHILTISCVYVRMAYTG